MAITLLLFCLLIQAAPSSGPETKANRQLQCVIFKTDEQSTQLWAVPQKDEIDIQAFVDKHWPVVYIHELGIIVRPPRNVTFEALSVVEIAKHQSLVTVDLSGTNVTDEDLSLLSSLPNLECLVLDATDVTDEGLQHLEKLQNLRLLSLHGCNVTVDAKSLRYVLPGVVVITGDGQTTVPVGNRN